MLKKTSVVVKSNFANNPEIKKSADGLSSYQCELISTGAY